jgi:hypothetical protein
LDLLQRCVIAIQSQPVEEIAEKEVFEFVPNGNTGVPVKVDLLLADHRVLKDFIDFL